MRRVLIPVLSGLLLAVLAACAGEPPDYEAAADRRPPALDEATLVDLSHPYDGATLYWPTETSRFEHRELAYGQTEGGYFYSAYTLSTPEHGGTHVDAPLHFAAGRWATDQIPLERLIGEAIVIDVAAEAAENPDYELTAADIAQWELRHGAVPADSIVLLRTGWGRFWPDAKAYLGDDTPGDASNLHFPSYGREAAHLLVDERKVAVLGVDTASIDPGNSTGFWVHRIANQSNVPGLENVANLEALPARGAWIVALPMKIAGGSGGPVRILALVPPAAATE